MDPNAYRTLGHAASAEFIERKSRFITNAFPVETEEEALSALGGIRALHRDATHHCYAYILGVNAGIMRYSDDGEPGGTAGLPILESMRQRGVVDALLVVTRYFGGVLLGAGGLARAYRQGAQLGLEAAGIVQMQRSVKLIVEVSYSCWQRLEYYLRTAKCLVLETAFEVSVVATLMVRLEDETQLLCDLTRISEGQALVLRDAELYHPWPQSS